MDLTVVDNPSKSRFEARTPDGQVAGFVDYTRDDDTIVLVHTQVVGDFEGQGVGSTLARGVFGLLHNGELTVVNACPFLRRFIHRHADEYDWVVDAKDR
jgi:molybdenum cofactor cytidylyltransferase